MMKPRNTIVIVRLIPTTEKRSGAIVVPVDNDLYGEAEVMAVGPGNVSASGGRSETFDLHPGQIVFMKTKEYIRSNMTPSGRVTMVSGTEYKVADQTYHMYEQSNIFAIIHESSDPDAGKTILLDSPAN